MAAIPICVIISRIIDQVCGYPYFVNFFAGAEGLFLGSLCHFQGIIGVLKFKIVVPLQSYATKQKHEQAAPILFWRHVQSHKFCPMQGKSAGFTWAIFALHRVAPPTSSAFN